MRQWEAFPRLCSMCAAMRTSGRLSLMSRDCERLGQRNLQGVSRPEGVKAGCDWTRATPKDAEPNATVGSFSTPLLYVRGDADKRPIEPYVEGLRAAGAEKLARRQPAGGSKSRL